MLRYDALCYDALCCSMNVNINVVVCGGRLTSTNNDNIPFMPYFRL